MDEIVKYIYTYRLGNQFVVHRNYSVLNDRLHDFYGDCFNHWGLLAIEDILIYPWMVYILELRDNTYYTGITNNLRERLKNHASGVGSKYVRGRMPFKIKYIEYYMKDRSEASKREAAIKSLTKSKKRDLMVDSDYFCRKCEIAFCLPKERR